MTTQPVFRFAFTGHRPPKIGGYNPQNPTRKEVRGFIATAVERIIARYGNTHTIEAITGGALGIDQDAAFMCMQRGVPYHLYAPCWGQDSRWPQESKNSYATVKKNAIQPVRYIHAGPYTNTCMQERNEAMVDDCDVLISVWDGTPGGTANCVRYAMRVGKPIFNYNPRTKRTSWWRPEQKTWTPG